MSQEKSHTRATTVVGDSGQTTTSSATRRSVRTGTLEQSSHRRRRRARASCRASSTDNPRQPPSSQKSPARQKPSECKPVKQLQPYLTLAGAFPLQLKSKLYLAQHTSCDLVCCNHLPNATESKAEKPKVEKQETAILIFFRGLQKVLPSKLAPVFGTKRISSRNIF